MNTPLTIANWKMGLGLLESEKLTSALAQKFPALKTGELWLAPSFPCLQTVVTAAESSEIQIGSQNVHWEDSGAFTGEVSAPVLKELGVQFCIVGHSERRHILGEDVEMAGKRAMHGLSSGLTVVFCIGETLEQREAGKTENVLFEQLDPVLKNLTSEFAANLVLAYEPVWAIGTGKVASIEQIESTHTALKNYWAKTTTHQLEALLYGGSVKPDNYREILSLSVVDGALVGGASLKLDSLSALVEIASEAKSFTG